MMWIFYKATGFRKRTSAKTRRPLAFPVPLPYNRRMSITSDLLNWYDQNRRVFAFRGTRDPYRIWISEIMLQQTRTETVEGYYARFMALFPDVFALAAADGQQVLKAWEGLGYYSRARNLHRTSKIIAERGGAFPRTAAELVALPGIGPYTAAAIASIAWDEPVPAMDGNLNRVLSRLYLIEEDITIPSVRRRLYELGRSLMPEKRAGDANQALMDLGATVCLPGTPDCPLCPLQAHCRAHQEGEPALLPVMPLKKPPKEIPMAVVLLKSGDKIFVTQRSEALLKGLYVYLLIEGAQSLEDVRKQLKARGIRPTALTEIGQARHIFTHRVWQMRIYLAEAPDDKAPAEGLWVSSDEMDALPFPTAMRAAKALAKERLQE